MTKKQIQEKLSSLSIITNDLVDDINNIYEEIGDIESDLHYLPTINENITRVVVVDPKGNRWFDSGVIPENFEFEIDLQDDNRTIKFFARKKGK